MSSSPYSYSDACSFGFSGEVLQYNISALVIASLGIILSIGLLGLYIPLAIPRKRRYAQKIAPWWLYITALVLSLISWIINLITIVLSGCDIITWKQENELLVTLNVLFYGFNYLIWLAVLMFPLTLSVLELANMPRRMIAVGFGILYAIVCLVWLGDEICSAKRSIDTDPDGLLDQNATLFKAWQGLSGTFAVLYFVATLTAGGFLIAGLVRLNGTSARTNGMLSDSQGLLISVTLTLLAFLGSNILTMYETFEWIVERHLYTYGSYTATGILDIVFILGAAAAMLFAAASRTWAPTTSQVPPSGAHDPYVNGAQPPYEVNGSQNYNYKDARYYGAAEAPGNGHAHHHELPSNTHPSEMSGTQLYEAPGNRNSVLH